MCKPPSLLAVPDASEELRRQAAINGEGFEEEPANDVSFDWDEGENGSAWLNPEEGGWDWTDACATSQPDTSGVPALVDAAPGKARTRAAVNTKTWKKPGLRPVVPAGMVQAPFMPGVMPYSQGPPMQGAWQPQVSPAQAWFMQQQMAQLGQQYLQASKMMMPTKVSMGGGRKGVGSVPMGFPVAGFPAPMGGFAGVPQMCQQPEQMPVQMDSEGQFEMLGNVYGAIPNPTRSVGAVPTQGLGKSLGKGKQVSAGAVPKVAIASQGRMAMSGTEDWGVDEGTDGEDMEDGVVCEKKLKRMLSNRASAKRSRQRRQERLDELEIQSAQLRVENAQLVRRQNESDSQLKKYAQENARLRAEVEELRALLETNKMSPMTSLSTKGAHSCAIESKAGSSKNQAESSKPQGHATGDETMADSPFGNETKSQETLLTSQVIKGSAVNELVKDDAGAFAQAAAASPCSNPSEDSAVDNDNQVVFVEPPDLLAFGPGSETMNGSGSVPGDGGMVVDEWFEDLCESFDGKPLEAFPI